MKGRAIPYSAEELAWLAANCSLSIVDYHAAFARQFARSDVSAANLLALRKRKGWKTGRTGRFETGQESWNKGQRCPDGKGGPDPNARATQFCKGQTPSNVRPLWSERLGKDGYIEMKVPVPNPYTGHNTRFMHKHRWNWEQVNGPLPKGQALKCIDGNRLNCDPKNWTAIPRGILPRLNGGPRKRHLAYDQAEPEVRPALIAIAQLDHKVRKATRA